MTRALAGALCALLAAGCAAPGDAPPSASSAPPVAAPAARPPAADGPLAQAHARWLERAQRAAAEGRLFDAVQYWERLALLQPDSDAHRRALAQARERAAAAAATHAANAAAARRRGELDAALTLYLKALAADPEHEAAARGAREIERERTRRLVNQRALTTNLSAPRM
jgi:tetratricopeptide (TPR) repeat protein